MRPILKQLLLCSICALGGLTLWSPRYAAQAPAAEPAEKQGAIAALFEKATVVESDDPLLKLKKERLNAALEELTLQETSYQLGSGTIVEPMNALARVRSAALAVATDDGKRALILKNYVKGAELALQWATLGYRAGIRYPGDVARTRHDKLDGQIQLLEFMRPAGEKK